MSRLLDSLTSPPPSTTAVFERRGTPIVAVTTQLWPGASGSERSQRSVANPVQLNPPASTTVKMPAGGVSVTTTGPRLGASPTFVTVNP